jgi:uncharacterized protein
MTDEPKPEQSELKMPASTLKVKGAETQAGDFWIVRLKPKKTIQTLVSDQVMVTLPELEIIDTPDFQRLRRVRQLGTSCMVYPTALHTRFDHSLGCLEMVERMLQAIANNEHNLGKEGEFDQRQRALARLYALLHDITHVPFGHTLEDELGVLTRHDKNTGRITHFLGPKSRIGRIIVHWFGKEFHETLLRIYGWNEDVTSWDGDPEDIFVHDLVSNTVCADLLDYVRRDDHFCNLGVGMSYPFINYLYLGEESCTIKGPGGKDRKVIARRVFVRLWKSGNVPRRDVLSDLCRLLEARYLIAERVYFHHAKVIAGAMLGRAIQEAYLAGHITEESMWQHSDDTLVHELLSKQTAKNAPLATKLAHAYQNRTLHKCAFQYRKEDIDQTQASDHSEDWKHEHIESRLGTADNRRAFEDHLADVLMVQPGDVLIYYPSHEGMNMKEAGMRVQWKGKQIPFRDVDDPVTKPRLQAVLDAHLRLWSIRVLVASDFPPDKLELLRELCDLELFTHGAEGPRKREELYEKIIRAHINEQEPTTAMLPADSDRKVSAVAKSLCQPAKDTRESFTQKLRKAVIGEFGPLSTPS